MFAKEFQLALLLITHRTAPQQQVLDFLRRPDSPLRHNVLVAWEKMARKAISVDVDASVYVDWGGADWSAVLELMDEMVKAIGPPDKKQPVKKSG